MVEEKKNNKNYISLRGTFLEFLLCLFLVLYCIMALVMFFCAKHNRENYICANAICSIEDCDQNTNICDCVYVNEDSGKENVKCRYERVHFYNE